MQQEQLVLESWLVEAGFDLGLVRRHLVIPVQSTEDFHYQRSLLECSKLE